MSETKAFRSVAGPAAGIRVVSVTRTCGGMPAQWDGVTDDGRDIYARYRYGHGSVQVAEHGDQSEYAAVHGTYVVSWSSEGAESRWRWDGDLTETELRAITGSCVTWPDEMPDVDLYAGVDA